MKLVAAIHHHSVAMIGNDQATMSTPSTPENRVQKANASASDSSSSVARMVGLATRCSGQYPASAKAVAMAAPTSIVPMRISGVGPASSASNSARSAR
jgi:hypothetical protein